MSQPSKTIPSKPFTNPTIHITTHDPSTGKAIVHSSQQTEWASPRPGVEFSVGYTTSSFPPSLNDDADINAHQDLLAKGSLGLVNPHGTVLRIVDFGPGHTPLMHRTQSLDYGVVLEGEILMELDSGEAKLLKKGDIAIQRGTMHMWRGVDATTWARMLFVLQDCQPLQVGGSRLKEQFGDHRGSIPDSGNDA